MEKKLTYNPLVILIILFIRLYQYFIAPLLGFNCRFFPSCSEYSLGSYKKFGFVKGSLLTLKRLSKCHPFGGKGFDPIEKNHEIKIKKVSISFIQAYRKKYLYSHLSPQLCYYNKDKNNSTIHLALFQNDKVISGLTLIENSFLENKKSFQIRGMFTINNCCKKGYGSLLIDYAKKKISDHNCKLLWCNARVEAIDFYKKNGFVEYGDFFLKKNIGKHIKMYSKL
tara:strand:- start:996 stop:1670 length:675 start_codon:yes stop_codon:yes gene_type:complete